MNAQSYPDSPSQSVSDFYATPSGLLNMYMENLSILNPLDRKTNPIKTLA